MIYYFVLQLKESFDDNNTPQKDLDLAEKMIKLILSHLSRVNMNMNGANPRNVCHPFLINLFPPV